jgi:hypothetical protein
VIEAIVNSIAQAEILDQESAIGRGRQVRFVPLTALVRG